MRVARRSGEYSQITDLKEYPAIPGGVLVDGQRN